MIGPPSHPVNTLFFRFFIPLVDQSSFSSLPAALSCINHTTPDIENLTLPIILLSSLNTSTVNPPPLPIPSPSQTTLISLKPTKSHKPPQGLDKLNQQALQGSLISIHLRNPRLFRNRHDSQPSFLHPPPPPLPYYSSPATLFLFSFSKKTPRGRGGGKLVQPP